MYLSTFSFIFYAWTISLVLQILGSSWLLTRPHNFLIDRGWALGRIVTWLSIGLIIWFLSFLRLPLNTNAGLWLVLGLFTAVSIYQIFKHKSTFKSSLAAAKKFILVEEILFLFGLTFLSIVRSFNPHVQDLEKPMDAGFMASYLRSATLPAPDMWLSGETINYYSFGHYLGSILTRIWHLDITYTYNLTLALIMGLALVLSFSIVINLLNLGHKKPLSTVKLIASGILGSVLVIIGGNTHTIWYFITNGGSWDGYWYADATRFIHNTIHEFPSYSFVVADIHAHVWNLPLVLSFLLVSIYWIKALFSPLKTSPSSAASMPATIASFLLRYRHLLISSAIMGIFIGIFAMTSAWDAMIYSLFLVIAGMVIVIYDYKKLPLLILSAITTISFAAITALPWFISFESISEGIAIVEERSPLGQFLALWTGHLIISLFALMAAIIILIKSKTQAIKLSPLLIITIVFTAWLLLLLPELIYFKDIYSGHPRANTMFKLTYQAFILMSLTGGWLIGIALTSNILAKPFRLISVILIGLITTAFLTFPYFAYPGYYGEFNNFQGLHGYQWLQDKYPADFAAAYWMQQNIAGQPVIMEAVGESYTDYARVSAYTGLPTVLGWRVHEWLWRGGFEIPGQRTTEVETIYNNPLSEESQQLLNTYQVEYIFVGEKEYETYPDMNIAELNQVGDIVYSQGRTFVIKRSSQ